MNPTRRYLMLSMLGLSAAMLAGRPALALNPQPEVPSKPGDRHDGQIRMLNPQPEVPSKPKKSNKHRQKKSKPGPQP